MSCHRARQNRRQKEYRAKHPEQFKAAKKRQYAADAENKKAIAARSREKHREARLIRQRESWPLRREREKGNTPDYRKVKARARRLGIKIIDETRPGDWLLVLNHYGRVCLCCGTNKSTTQDHVIPLSKGGRHHISNFQPLCGPCNNKKGVKDTDYRRSIPCVDALPGLG